MYQPPTCPKCGKPLTIIYLERTTTAEWDEEEKEFYDNGQGAGTTRCGSCGEVIGGYGQRPLWGIWPDFE
jgi:DNA-directed RNA polymerase subunit N (RpoN/RPB10)